MARMYEMNLIIRLQDRASARMRRISGDMSAMSRHVQAQNKLMNMRTSLIKEYGSQAARIEQVESRTAKNGVTRLRDAAALKTIRAQILTQEVQAARFADSDSKRAQAARMRLTASRLRERALIAETKAEEASLTRQIEASVIAQQRLNAEIARQAAIQAAGAKSARNFQTGRALAHGGSLAFMGGAVTVGVAALAAQSYAKFDVASTKAATQVGNTNLKIGASIAQTKKSAADLEQRLLGLTKQFPATAEEMASASYNIFSSMDLGNTAAERMANGMKVLTEANKAAIGGQVDLATATDTLITVFNDFDPRLSSLSKNMAELFSIVRFMRGGFEELNAGMNKLAPAARQAKQSLIEVGAAYAVVTQAIPSAAQAATAEARLMDMFGSKDFINGMARAGEGITKRNGQLVDLSKILDHIVALDPSLVQGGPKLTQFVKEITRFGSETGKGGSRGLIQMQRALTVLITEHVKHLRILKQAKQDTVEYEKSVKALSDTADVRWKIGMNQLRVAFIQFGQAAMPVLLGVLGAFTKAMDFFNGLSGGTRKFIGSMVVIVGLLAVVGGLFTSAFGGIAMVVATVRLRKLQAALESVAIANEEVAATSVGSKAGILGMGKAALRATGWLLLLYAAFKSLQDAKNIQQNTKGTWWQKLARYEAGKGLVSGLAGFVGQGKRVSDAYDKLFKRFPGLFGTTVKKVKKDAKELSDIRDTVETQTGKAGLSKLDKIMAINKAAAESDKKLADYEKRLAKATTEAKQSALKQQKTDIDSAAKNLVAKYKELETANKSAIGGILSGPISGGPILSAFKSINDTLMGFGIKPIKVPLQFIMQDATQQLANFDLWRGGLKKLSKKIPTEMLQELTAAGIDKLPEILSLADAGPGFIKQYVQVWKDTKSARDAATKADMDSTLKLWNSYGKDIAWQIVNGLVDSGAEAKMYNSFSKMITSTFAVQLNKSMQAAVDLAIADWKASNPRPKVTKGASVTNTNWANGVVSAAAQVNAAADYQANMLSHGWYTASGGASNPNLQPKPNFTGPGGKGNGGGGGSAWATGGIIPGRGMGDTVPAMLTPGEVVLNKRQIANASQMLGTANHPHAVFNKVQHFAKGGVAAAQNYMHMKGVSIQQDPKTGAISVINGAGVRYRVFRHGQPGWNELNKYTMAHPNMGGGGIRESVVAMVKSYTPHGLMKQAKDAYTGYRHPVRTLFSGGLMMYPGAKPKGKIAKTGNIFDDPGEGAALKARIDSGTHVPSTPKPKDTKAGFPSADTIARRQAEYKARVAANADRPLTRKQTIAKNIALAKKRQREFEARHGSVVEAKHAEIRAAITDARVTNEKLHALIVKTRQTLTNIGDLPEDVAARQTVMDRFTGHQTKYKYDPLSGEVVMEGRSLTYAGKGQVLLTKLHSILEPDNGLTGKDWSGGKIAKARRVIMASEQKRPTGKLSSMRKTGKHKIATENRPTDPKALYRQLRKIIDSEAAQGLIARAKDETGTLDVSKFTRSNWFHGTPEDWKSFDHSKANKLGLLGPALYLSRLKGTAETYANIKSRMAKNMLNPPTAMMGGGFIKEFEFHPEKLWDTKGTMTRAEWDELVEAGGILDGYGHRGKLLVTRTNKAFDDKGVNGSIFTKNIEMVLKDMRRSYVEGQNSLRHSFAVSEEMNVPYKLTGDVNKWFNLLLSHAGYDGMAMDYERGMSHDVLGILPKGMPNLRHIRTQHVPHKFAKGGWVKGSGNRDNVPAFLTPGEYVVSKPMIRDLTSKKSNGATSHTTYEQNINVDVTNPTGKAILDALKPVLFGLRHQP
jgi:hypothetical protein